MVNKKAANPVGSAALVLRAAASLSDHLFISRAAGPSWAIRLSRTMTRTSRSANCITSRCYSTSRVPCPCSRTGTL